jgi:anti-sigma B factor antagonist
MAASEKPAASGFEVALECGDEGPVVRLRGAATMEQADLLRDHLLALAASLDGRLVLDLTNLEFINSVGLGAMVTAHLRCQRLGGWLRIANPPSEIRHLLVLTNLTKLFDVYGSVGEALRGKGAPAAE